MSSEVAWARVGRRGRGRGGRSWRRFPARCLELPPSHDHPLDPTSMSSSLLRKAAASIAQCWSLNEGKCPDQTRANHTCRNHTHTSSARQPLAAAAGQRARRKQGTHEHFLRLCMLRLPSRRPRGQRGLGRQRARVTPVDELPARGAAGTPCGFSRWGRGPLPGWVGDEHAHQVPAASHRDSVLRPNSSPGHALQVLALLDEALLVLDPALVQLGVYISNPGHLLRGWSERGRAAQRGHSSAMLEQISRGRAEVGAARCALSADAAAGPGTSPPASHTRGVRHQQPARAGSCSHVLCVQ